MGNVKVNDDLQSEVMGFFQDFLPISIKDTLLLIKALFRLEAQLKDLKNMHEKTLNGIFRWHFAWMEASKSYITNYLYEFAAIIEYLWASSFLLYSNQKDISHTSPSHI